MKKQKVLEKNIEDLGLESKITTVLKANKVEKIEDIWTKKRKEVKEYGFSDSEIMQITIKLQLYGLDLNKKVY